MNPIDPRDGEPIQGFKGLFSRSDSSTGLMDEVPPDHLSDCLNIAFPGPSQIKTRESTVNFGTGGGNACTFFQGALVGRLFFLSMSGGKLYDSGTEIHDFGTAADDFAAINLYTRIYITPIKNNAAIAGEFLYYYDGTNFSKTGGATPTSAPTVTQPSSGNVTAGDHIVAVCFVTRTGFITKPGPPAIFTADGLHNFSLSSIPTGPAGTVARVILMTKANETEYFFVPNGTINDNTTTTATFDVSDLELISSADYLNDILEFPPSCADLRFYNRAGRLALIGPAGFVNDIWFSRPQDPETIDLTTSRVIIPHEDDGNILRTAWDLRDSFYAVKFAGIYGLEDNLGDPRTWPVSNVDSSLGCFQRGKASFTSAETNTDSSDYVIIANKAGVFRFDGVHRFPPLSWKIEALWNTVNFAYFGTASVAKDIWLKRIYFCVPIGNSATSPTHILMMDYADGLDLDKVKWSIWTLPNAPRCIGMALMSGDSDYPGYTLRISTAGTSNILRIKNTITPGTDNGSAFTSSAQLAPYTKSPGNISVFTGARIRVLGSGSLTLNISGQKNTSSTNLTTLTMANPADDLFRTFNLESEKLHLKLSTAGWFHIGRVDIFSKIKWMTRPA